jgi:hypothetical protein
LAKPKAVQHFFAGKTESLAVQHFRVCAIFLSDQTWAITFYAKDQQTNKTKDYKMPKYPTTYFCNGELLERFEPTARSTDVYICTSAKCGQTWLQTLLCEFIIIVPVPAGLFSCPVPLTLEYTLFCCLSHTKNRSLEDRRQISRFGGGNVV